MWVSIVSKSSSPTPNLPHPAACHPPLPGKFLVSFFLPPKLEASKIPWIPPPQTLTSHQIKPSFSAPRVSLPCHFQHFLSHSNFCYKAGPLVNQLSPLHTPSFAQPWNGSLEMPSCTPAQTSPAVLTAWIKPTLLHSAFKDFKDLTLLYTSSCVLYTFSFAILFAWNVHLL